MKIFKDFFLPIFSKLARLLLDTLKQIALDLAKKIPEAVIKPIQAKIIEVSKMSSLGGKEKLDLVKEFAINLLGDKFASIGHSAVDTLIQNLYYKLKNEGTVE